MDSVLTEPKKEQEKAYTTTFLGFRRFLLKTKQVAQIVLTGYTTNVVNRYFCEVYYGNSYTN